MAKFYHRLDSADLYISASILRPSRSWEQRLIVSYSPDWGSEFDDAPDLRLGLLGCNYPLQSGPAASGCQLLLIFWP